jgi:protein TonB
MRALALAWAVALLLVATEASGQAVVGPRYKTEPPITEPAWTKTPDRSDLMRHFPKEARKAHVSGYSTISCVAAADGILADCVSIAPSTPEFGEAALKLAPLFKMRAKDASGALTEGRTIRIPIMFRAPN